MHLEGELAFFSFWFFFCSSNRDLLGDLKDGCGLRVFDFLVLSNGITLGLSLLQDHIFWYLATGTGTGAHTLLLHVRQQFRLTVPLLQNPAPGREQQLVAGGVVVAPPGCGASVSLSHILPLSCNAMQAHSHMLLHQTLAATSS